jgi:cysteine desulfurase
MIYFDNAATTRCSQETIDTLIRYADRQYFNPSSVYHEAVEVKIELDAARNRILKAAGGGEGKIIFTSGGTESDNLAVFGTRKPNKSKVIVSAAEHAAIYNSAMELKRRGFEVCLCPVDGCGRVDEDAFRMLLDETVSFVSIIHVNNETGAINDIRKLCALTKAANPSAIFHSDGVQALGKIPVNLTDSGVDLYSLSAHKLNAPKGCGALYVRKGVHLNPIVYGGGQEEGLRSSTENVGAIIAFSDMVSYYTANRIPLSTNMSAIKQIIKRFLSEAEGIRFLTGEPSSDYILTFASDKLRGEVTLHALNREGILVGTGSACSSAKASRRIAEVLGLKGKYVDGIVRLSFGRYNTQEEALAFCAAYKKIYEELSRYGS